MTKNEINIGDKVRLKEFPAMNPYYKGRVCEIASIDNNGYVTFKDGGIHPEVWELELVEPLDRRTAFLSELQALLRKYDARIYDEDEHKVIIDLDIHCEKGERIECMGTDGEVNADNIMDFDKE